MRETTIPSFEVGIELPLLPPHHITSYKIEKKGPSEIDIRNLWGSPVSAWDFSEKIDEMSFGPV